MSSIRPLATIALLAIAGVYLYFKINETQPQLPVDVADWTLPVEVEIQEQVVVNHPPNAPVYESTNPTDLVTSASNHVPPTTQSVTLSDNLEYPPLPEIPPATTAQSTLPRVPAVGESLVSPSSTPVALSVNQQIAGTTTDAKSNLDLNVSQGLPPLISPSASSSPPISPTPQTSLFGATRLTVQGELDRGRLSRALLLLSDWYGDPSLTAEEIKEVNGLLSQLAGSVIYSTEHRLLSPHVVKTGEHLEDIAKQYQVPWQLLAKINGIDRPDQLPPGKKLKVLRGPFSALIDLDNREMTLMLERRYAGKFAIDIDHQVTVEEGQWIVEQKLVTPGSLSLDSSNSLSSPVGEGTPRASEEQSLILTNRSSENGQIAVLRGPGMATPGVATEPENRVIRLNANDVGNIFDILSVGSKVIIRR